MAGKSTLPSGLASYQSFRPNVYTTNSSLRVSSDLSATAEDKSSHRHKSHHRHHRHISKDDRHSSARRHAKEVVQSAIQLQPPTSFGDLLKQARGSKDTSPSHSRKGSIAPGTADANGEVKENGNNGITIAPRRRLRKEDVELERRRMEMRERDLRAALQSLSDQSLKTSRRLDDTYYSILEKVTVLRQTIGTLQELSGLTKELHENFESDTKELVDDVKGQFDSFDNFNSQQQQIIDLENRINSGKDKADLLTGRLAKAKEDVDARVRSEADWETTNSRRRRWFWGTIGSVVGLMLALILFHQLKPMDISHDSKPALDFATRVRIQEADIPDMAKEVIIGTSNRLATMSTLTPSAVSVPGEHKSLRAFDEL